MTCNNCDSLREKIKQLQQQLHDTHAKAQEAKTQIDAIRSVLMIYQSHGGRAGKT